MTSTEFIPWIVCAAMRHSISKRIICGARHYDPIMRAQIKAEKDVWTSWIGCEQGFIDQKGTFYNRQDAWVIAEKNGQIKRRVGGDTMDGGTLFSESLY